MNLSKKANQPGDAQPDNNKWYLNTKGAAIYLGVGPRYLEKLRQNGGGPIFSKPGRKKVFYTKDDLDAWVAGGRRKNTSQSSPKMEG